LLVAGPASEKTAIADAVADVALAAQRIVDERIDLLRLDLRTDMRTVLGAAVVSAAGIGAVVIAVGAGAAALVWTIALWLPLGAALAIVCIACLGFGVLMTRRARARIPTRLDDAPALPRSATP
jgi:hypothetical protein